MSKENIVIAVYTNKTPDSKNFILDSFAQSLIQGFKNCGVKAYSYDYCKENNITFNMAIGFDTTGLEHWQKTLSNGVTNVMWATDSVFKKNIDAIEQFSSFDKFVVFESTPADINEINKFLPQLKHGYIPHAVDISENSTTNKENDITFISDIEDYEEKAEKLKQTYPEIVYNLIMQIKDIVLKNPNLTFSQIAEIVNSNYGIELDKAQYIMLFNKACELVENEQKVKIIHALSNFNVKIYGNDLWRKYITGNIEYCGQCTNFEEYKKILNNSKIVLYTHPLSLGLGISERILNAADSNALCLCSSTPSIIAEFPDGLVYFNNSDFKDIAQKAEYYLANEDKRKELVERAKNIIKEKHTWTNRAQSILDITD